MPITELWTALLFLSLGTQQSTFCLWTCLGWASPMHGILHYVAFCIWLLSFSVMRSASSVCSVGQDFFSFHLPLSFLFMAE